MLFRSPSGQVAAAIDKVLSCEELIQEIMCEANSCLEELFKKYQTGV